LNWEEYSKKCERTLCYKRDEEKIVCSTLEIIDEIAEFLEHFQGGSDSKLLNLELGDITYGMAILANQYGITLKELKSPYAPINKMTSSVYSNLIDDGLMCAGLLAGVMKKTIRDDNYVLTDTKNRKEKFTFYMSSLYTYIIDYCDIHKVNFSDILSWNVEKLADRQKRNVIQGDGDLR